MHIHIELAYYQVVSGVVRSLNYNVFVSVCQNHVLQPNCSEFQGATSEKVLYIGVSIGVVAFTLRVEGRNRGMMGHLLTEEAISWLYNLKCLS